MAIVVMRPDRHCRTADHHWIPGRRRLHSETLCEHFRARIGPGHVIARQRIVCWIVRTHGAEEDGFRRAVQEAFHIAPLRLLEHDFSATAIDGVKIAFPRHPHPRKAGKVINVLDVVHRPMHQVAIKH